MRRRAPPGFLFWASFQENGQETRAGNAAKPVPLRQFYKAPMSEKIFQELQHLPGLPLTKATRLGHVQFFHFGKAQVTNAYGLILDVGAWTLEVACYWQLEQPGETGIQFHEVELPRDARALADPAFDPQVPGSNLRDRKLQELVRQPSEQLRVQQVTVSPDGELTIALGGNQVLLVSPAKGVLEEAGHFWRLFSNTGDRQAVAFGRAGVERSQG